MLWNCYTDDSIISQRPSAISFGTDNRDWSWLDECGWALLLVNEECCSLPTGSSVSTLPQLQTPLCAALWMTEHSPVHVLGWSPTEPKPSLACCFSCLAPPTVQGYCMRQENKVPWMGIRKGKIISLWQDLKSASPALWNMLLTKALCSNKTSALWSGLVTGIFVLHPQKIGSDTLLPLQTKHQAESCPHL